MDVRDRGGGVFVFVRESVVQLAKQRGNSKQDAAKPAVQSELDRASEAAPLPERFARLRAANALPPRTGKAADKAFFDDLYGGL